MFIGILIASIILFSCSFPDVHIEETIENFTDKTNGTFIDTRDSKTYKYVSIGTQIWMAENLNYDASGSKCYDEDPANCEKYGRLYDWETAMKACPEGWRLPTDTEWAILINFVKNVDTDLVSYLDNYASAKLKATEGWIWHGQVDHIPNGTDNYGFSALPSGYCSTLYENGNYVRRYNDINYVGSWWTATERPSGDYVSNRKMNSGSSSIRSYDIINKNDLISARCIKE